MTTPNVKDVLFSFAKARAQANDISLNEAMTCDEASLDSLDLLEISYEIEDVFDIVIDPAEMGDLNQTIGQFIEKIETQIQNAKQVEGTPA